MEGRVNIATAPPLARERRLPAKDGLVRITPKRAFSDGTVAIDLAPLSLLSRLAAAVPYPRLHTVRFSGVLASASKLRAKIAPKQEPIAAEGEAQYVHHAITCEMPNGLPKRGPYRRWAELLKRTFDVDVLHCPTAKVACGCSRCSPRATRSGAICVPSASPLSCQLKRRQ
jgi:Putative transposase